MTRILKRYKLNYHLKNDDSTPVPGIQVDFSSYPGSVTSQDEFYLLQGKKHRLAITGTSLRNYNNKLWKEVDIIEQVSNTIIGFSVTENKFICRKFVDAIYWKSY